MKRETMLVHVRVYKDQEKEIRDIATETKGNATDIRKVAIDKGLLQIKQDMGKDILIRDNTYYEGDTINVVMEEGKVESFKIETNKVLTKIKK